MESDLPRAKDLGNRLTPERLALFQRIVALRERIGKVDFDVVRELAKLRGRPE